MRWNASSAWLMTDFFFCRTIRTTPWELQSLWPTSLDTTLEWTMTRQKGGVAAEWQWIVEAASWLPPPGESRRLSWQLRVNTSSTVASIADSLLQYPTLQEFYFSSVSFTSLGTYTIIHCALQWGRFLFGFTNDSKTIQNASPWLQIIMKFVLI